MQIWNAIICAAIEQTISICDYRFIRRSEYSIISILEIVYTDWPKAILI